MLRRFARAVVGHVVFAVLTVSVAAPDPSAAQTTGMNLAATAFDVVRLAPDAPAPTSAFLVSDATAVVFDAVSSVGNVGIVVITPGGGRLTEAGIGSIGGSIERRSIAANSAGPLLNPLGTPGEHIIISIPKPEAGMWGLEFSAPPGNTAEIAVAVTAIMSSATAAALIASPEDVVRSRAVSLTLAAFSGAQPLTGAVVQAEVVSPGGAVSTLALLDDGNAPDAGQGDGLYSAGLIPATAGVYRALAVVTGVAAGGASVVRHGAATFTVVEPTLAILGSVPVRTVDTNFNGLIDEVVLDISVNVLVAGDFSARAVLTASNGATLSRTVHVTLPATGNTVVPVSFSASELRGLGVDGPYHIGPIEIVFLGESGAVPADRLEDAGLTPAILLSALERPRIEYAGTFTDAGVDLDGDGLFDRLNVDLGMAFVVPGSYSWSAILFDRNARQLGFSSGSAFFTAGTSALRLAFAGESIGANGVDGPYTVGNLLVSGVGGSLVLRTVTQTSGFLARQFEGFVSPDTTPPSVIVSPSPTSISPPNGKLVPVTISGSMTDDLSGIDSSSAAFSVVDEYGEIQPSGPIVVNTDGSYSFSLMLEARRRGDDLDGRRYQINVSVADLAGNIGSAASAVLVPHDQGVK